MTDEQTRKRAEALSHDIMEILEGEAPEAAVHALAATLGILIFHNTGSQSEAASKAAAVGTNITKIAREQHAKFSETAGA